jgi:solute carrier family 25 protein 34/35
MQPADTALTRVYNQPTEVSPDGRIRGLLYRNPIDCLWKTFKAEGIKGWYKGLVGYKYPQAVFTGIAGSTAHFLRIAPHTYALFFFHFTFDFIHIIPGS